MKKFSVLMVSTAVVSAILLVALVTTVTFAQAAGPDDMGPGMMGSQGMTQCVAPVTPMQTFLPSALDVFGSGSPGMMDGQGMIGDQGCYRFGASTQRQTAEQVQQAVATYLAGYYDNPDLVVVKLMEFEQNFYAQIAEKSTGINAGELLINPYTGAVQPEYGPNRMWNTKYGQTSDMGGMMPNSTSDGLASVQPTAAMPVTAEQASKLAQRYLDAQTTNLKVEKGLDGFYGYYTVHTLDKAGNTVGMLSVNGYTGQIWNHIWQGKFVGAANGM